MSEYVVRETGYPGAIKQEIVGELVRCGECKWFTMNTVDALAEGICGTCLMKWPGMGYVGLDYPKPDSFCSRGERKGEE